LRSLLSLRDALPICAFSAFSIHRHRHVMWFCVDPLPVSSLHPTRDTKSKRSSGSTVRRRRHFRFGTHVSVNGLIDQMFVRHCPLLSNTLPQRQVTHFLRAHPLTTTTRQPPLRPPSATPAACAAATTHNVKSHPLSLDQTGSPPPRGQGPDIHRSPAAHRGH